MARCTARSKRSGEQCKRAAAVGRKTCSMHGGKSLVGPAAPAWVDGTHSKILPKRMMDDYRASLNDPEKLALSNAIALLDARLADLLRRVDNGESGALWGLLRTTWHEYEAARRANDPVALMTALQTLGEVISRGHSDALAWQEIRGIVQERRKVVESDRRRLVQQHEVVTRDQAMALLGMLVTAVQQHVRDESAVAAIAAEYARLTGAGA